MSYDLVETVLAESVDLKCPECADTLCRAESAVCVLIVEEVCLVAPELLIYIFRKMLDLVLHILDLLPALDVESDLKERLVHENLLKVSVKPYHVTM